ncbi:MAG: Pre-rRNA-processing protein ipi3 [Chaenotheca gracillima]|nr:MAG: Pre-rRNA-processing protein ipi3 [Chaenotheca gracillima]
MESPSPPDDAASGDIAHLASQYREPNFMSGALEFSDISTMEEESSPLENKEDRFQFWGKLYGIGLENPYDSRVPRTCGHYLSRLSPVSEKDSISLSPSRKLRRRMSQDRSLRSAFIESESRWIKGETRLMTWFDDTSSHGSMTDSTGRKQSFEEDPEDYDRDLSSSDDESADDSVVLSSSDDSIEIVPMIRTKAILRDIPSRSSRSRSRTSSEEDSTNESETSTREKMQQRPFQKPFTPPSTPGDEEDFRTSKSQRASFFKTPMTFQPQVPRNRIRKKSITRAQRPALSPPITVHDGAVFDSDIYNILSQLESSTLYFPEAALHLESPVIIQVRCGGASSAPASPFPRITSPIQQAFSLHRRAPPQSGPPTTKNKPRSLSLSSHPSAPLHALSFAGRSLGLTRSASQDVSPLQPPSLLQPLLPASTPPILLNRLHATLLAMNYLDSAIARAPSSKAVAILGISRHSSTNTTTSSSHISHSDSCQHQSDDLARPGVTLAQPLNSTFLARLYALRDALKSCVLLVLKEILHPPTTTMHSEGSMAHSNGGGSGCGDSETDETLIRVLAAFIKLSEERVLELAKSSLDGNTVNANTD